jgi:cell division transport system ATP-binding protein
MLVFEDVVFRYDENILLDEINFRIEEGEFVYLTGKSGVGKSTIIRLITGAVKMNSGSIIFDEFNYEKLKEKDLPNLRRKLGIVFQDFKFLQDRTIYQNLSYIMEIFGYSFRSRRKKILSILSDVGLSDKKDILPSQLSGGELQRAAIARALLNNPMLVLADEPTGNLDPETSEEILDLFLKINKRGTAVLFTTHDYSLIKDNSKVFELRDKKLFEKS